MNDLSCVQWVFDDDDDDEGGRDRIKLFSKCDLIWNHPCRQWLVLQHFKMADRVELFQWNISCTQFRSSCQHTEEPHHVVRQLWRTGCEKYVEGSSNRQVSVMVIQQGPRRGRLMRGYSKVHITDKFEYLNMWLILNDPCPCIEQLDLTLKPTNEHKGMKVFCTHCVFCTLLLLVFSPWAGLGRDQSSVRRLVWLWYAASWASS